MSQDLINSLLRSLGASLGGALASWFVAKGWLSVADAATVIGAVTGVLLSAGTLVWGAIAHREVNLVATVAALPNVSKVETVSTQAGRDLAAATGSTLTAVVTVAR